MKRKTNKTKEEAWSQTAHAPDGEQPGPEASDTSGQSVPKSKFRKKSQQEQAAAAKLHMESQGEKLEQAREKLAKQKPPKKPGPVKRIGRVASGSVHSFVHGKIFEVEQENVGTEGVHQNQSCHLLKHLWLKLHACRSLEAKLFPSSCDQTLIKF